MRKKFTSYRCRGLLSATLPLLLATVSCVTDNMPSGPDRVVPGDRLPWFEAVTDRGDTVSPASLAGEPALLVFFNTSCGDCRRELPEIQRFYETHPDVTTVCIARTETAPSIARFWTENGLTIPWSPQQGREVFDLFAESGIPRLFAVGADGIVFKSYSDNDAPTADQLDSLFRTLPR